MKARDQKRVAIESIEDDRADTRCKVPSLKTQILDNPCSRDNVTRDSFKQNNRNRKWSNFCGPASGVITASVCKYKFLPNYIHYVIIDSESDFCRSGAAKTRAP